MSIAKILTTGEQFGTKGSHGQSRARNGLENIPYFSDETWLFLAEANLIAGHRDLALAALGNCSGPSESELLATDPGDETVQGYGESLSFFLFLYFSPMTS